MCTKRDLVRCCRAELHSRARKRAGREGAGCTGPATRGMFSPRIPSSHRAIAEKPVSKRGIGPASGAHMSKTDETCTRIRVVWCNESIARSTCIKWYYNTSSINININISTSKYNINININISIILIQYHLNFIITVLQSTAFVVRVQVLRSCFFSSCLFRTLSVSERARAP